MVSYPPPSDRYLLAHIDRYATDKAELRAKKLFFSQLSALNESSDEEYGMDNVRPVPRKSRKLLPLASLSKEFTPRRNGAPFASHEPTIQRTTSAPTLSSGFITKSFLAPKESPSHYSEPATLLSAETSVIVDTPEPWPYPKQRCVSNPTMGTDSLLLNYSTGIESMLGKRNRTGSGNLDGKKKLRKKPSVELVPEPEQIFKGLVFYYVPPDDKAQLRRIRINQAIKFGATWTRELTPNTTHIVVDKALTFKDVMIFLKLETLPSNITMVSEEYPIDSIKSKFLLDPKQKRYSVSGYQETLKESNAPQTTPPVSATTLEFKASKSKARAGDAIILENTPPRSEESTQVNGSKEGASRVPIDSSQDGAEAQNERHRDSEIVQIPNEAKKSPEPCDELERMIKVARCVEDVPINDEDDDREDDIPLSREQSDGSGSDDGPRRPRSHSTATSKWKASKGGSFNQETFRCMAGGTGETSESNPNSRTIDVLQKMADYYSETKDHWRQTAYRKTIGVLRKQHTKISSYEEAFRLPTIGHRLALKIEEIVLTNGLRRLTDAMSDPHYHVLHTFMNIYGVGINQAWKWVQQGHTTLEDLKAHVALSKNQRLGIEHYDEFLMRIPRDEVTALGNVVRAAAAKIDPGVEVIIGGSYRRGATTSGDIDFIFTKPSTSSTEELLDFLMTLTNNLTESGFLVAALVVPSKHGSKWHGCCVLPGAPNPIWRRIDMLLVPATQLGAALIYFTGDDIFNRSIRLLASKKGWRLNQRGLYKDVLRGPGRVKLNEGSLIEGADEKKILAALGVPWRPPEERICN